MKERPSPAPEESGGVTLSRRELLIRSGYLAGSVMLAGPLAACGTSSSTGTPTTSSSPKKGGNFRLGVTGGGAKDFIDGQTIVTKPDQARLVERTQLVGFICMVEVLRMGTSSVCPMTVISCWAMSG